MRDPGELQRAVNDELAFDPTVDASAIGVAVTGEGVVTLQGHVDS
jgi:osmotically-inducible protein OsmY